MAATLYLVLLLQKGPVLQQDRSWMVQAGGLQRLLVERIWSDGHLSGAPPVGASYRGDVRLPVLGRQKFAVTVLSRTRAQIRLEGAMSLDEPAEFVVGPDGSVRYVFNEPTTRLLRRVSAAHASRGGTPGTPSRRNTNTEPSTSHRLASASACDLIS